MSSGAVTRLPVRGPFGRFPHVAKVIIVGLTFSGKTTLAEELTAEARRRVYFSTRGADYVRPGRTVVTVPELLARPELLRGSDMCLVVHSSDPDDAQTVAREVSALVAMVRRVCSDDATKKGLGWGGCVLVLDECGDYMDPAEGGDCYECAKVAVRLARNGRHDNVVPIFVSQDAADIPRGVHRQATHVYSLIQVDESSLDRLKRRCGPAFAEAAAEWTPGSPPVCWVLPTLKAHARET